MTNKLKTAFVFVMVLALVLTAAMVSACKKDAAVEEAVVEESTAKTDDSQQQAGDMEADIELEENKEEQSVEVIEVLDGDGNTITLEEPAQKVIVLAPSALEIIDGLGAMDLVIEVDNFIVMMQEPLAEGFEGVGDSQSLNVERIAELDPDILITITGGPEEDYNKVAELGIPIYRKTESMGIEGIYEEISNISKLIGLEEAGQQMAGDLKTAVEQISGKVKDLAEADRPTVFYEVWNEPLMSAGKGTFLNDLIEKAGGVNILVLDDVSGWAEYSLETLVDKNPDIIIAPMSVAIDPSVIKEDTRLASIDAVINDRVYIVPDNPVSRTSQNVIKGLEMFARAIHPEIFGEFKIVE
jgi:iron complex transport system substrate-binding protein